VLVEGMLVDIFVEGIELVSDEVVVELWSQPAKTRALKANTTRETMGNFFIGVKLGSFQKKYKMY
jgi:hypothetical protein